jgi:glycosyltransferase involved in cell wall biosynthesis
VFVHPSLEDGFGLPLLEAMACGAPVIAFDNSSVPEVAGDAAVLVPTGSTGELARRMVEVLTDEGLRRRLSARGLARAREFSWERCARETIAAYERAAGAPSLSP